MKILILSSLPQDTGAWLRASYCAKSLLPHADVELVRPFRKGFCFMLDVLISLPFNTYKALFTSADVLVGFKPFPNVTIPLLLAKIIRNKTVVIDIDDMDYGFFSPVPAMLIKVSQTFFPRFFDMVTTHNSVLEDFIVKVFNVKRTNIYLLQQGVDLQIFHNRNRIRRKNSLIYVGHLNIASELEIILQAVSFVLKERKVVFTVAGGGPSEKYFRKRAMALGVPVRFTGHIPNTVIAEEIAGADICLVYYKENDVNRYRCSMKLRECLALGNKIVCNDFRDAKSFAAYTYQTSSVIEEYSRKILSVMDASDGRERKGALYVCKHLNWASIGKDFHDALSRQRGL
jgi:glycosyltransferase involved in cell wall biosynthesis